ncbi:MAG: ARMT1-like domain-containing protein [Armatimonadota bacterium]
MRTCLDCIPCFFRQALEAARLAGAGKKMQKKVLDELADTLPGIPLDLTPPEIARIIYKLIGDVTGVRDPLRKIKDQSNKEAMKLYPSLKKKVNASKNKILTSIRLAIAGNIIDYGSQQKFNVEKEIKECLKKKFTIFDYDKFKKALKKTDTVLYLADNAGEIVFDRILIEALHKKVIFAVKEKPAINDAMKRDAYFCGLDKVSRVISSGSDAAGTILNLCSPEFLKIYKESKMIISKGQGNYEALAGEKKPVFFLIRIKCPVIAGHINCKVGDIVLKSAL